MKRTKYKIPKINNGITLIALVITIIVMLILVAVTISMAVNGGLFQKAGEATSDTKNAIKSEQTLANGQIKIGDTWYASIQDYLDNIPMGEGILLNETSIQLEIEADYDVETSEKVTADLTAVLNKLEGDVTWTSNNEEVATVEGNGTTAKVTAVGEGTAKITASCVYGGEKYTAECNITVETATQLKVGDYVNYTPTAGTYTVASGTNGSGYSSNQSFETETGDDALQWRVLSINEKTGEIEIVSATAAQVSTNLYLQEADGYNHGVDILNDLCEFLYSKTENGEKVATARSINEKDINDKTTYDYTSFTNELTGYYYGKTGNLMMLYGSTKCNFPSIELKGLERSKGLEDRNTNGDGVTSYETVSGSMSFTSTGPLTLTYSYYTYDPEEYLAELGVNSAPAGLLTVQSNYWVATRCAALGLNYASYDLFFYSSQSSLGGDQLFNSTGLRCFAEMERCETRSFTCF